MKQINSLLFDLDGTIIAPEEGIVNSLIYAYHQMRLPVPTHQELLEFIGPPLLDSFTKRYQWPLDKANEAIAHYRDRFASKGVLEHQLYDGIGRLLKKLHQHDFRIFLATSKPTVFAEQILEQYQFDALFEGIVGSNLDNTRSQKHEIIGHVLEHYQVNPTEALMIGDRSYDMIGAKSHELKAIGVLYGHGNQQELEDAGADVIVHDVAELENAIEYLVKR